jgi:hypothetical protein
MSAPEQAEYLAHFRAGASMRDAEVYRWMFEDYGALVPLGEAAHLLAQREWPALYDAADLERNGVPAAAAIYANDMYVERSFSEKTVARIGGLRACLTNEYEHNWLRADGERVPGRLIELVRGPAC